MITKKPFSVLVIIIILTLVSFNVLDVSANKPSKPSRQEMTGYSKISSGYHHVCAINDSGELKCWGSNTYGQIGDDSYSFVARSTPGSVPGLENETIIDFEAGGDNTCIINSEGALKCWGENSYHELGNSEYFYWASGRPIQVSGMSSGVTDVAIGLLFTCALKDGDAYCWGYDYTAAEPNTVIEEPQLVNAPYSFVSITANGGDVCAITTDGQLACWGLNYEIPTIISGLENVVSVSISETEKCALIAETATDPAKVMCWGGTPIEVIGLQGIPLAIAGGKNHTCAIVQDAGNNAVMCWGRNNEGQLGIGNTTDVSVPTLVTGSEGAVQLSAGEFHTNIITDSGQVRSWGANTEGQLGNGALFRRQLPIHLQNISEPLKNVVSGEYHTCALTQSGSVWCWGGNEFGQVGNGGTQYVSEPVNVLNGEVEQIFAGSYDTCALLDTSELMCWGINPSGSLGTNELSNYSPTPRFVVNVDNDPITGVIDVGCGNSYICALMSDGSVSCWGANNFGQLGVSVIENSWSANPIPVQNLPGSAIALTVGQEHTCAITDTLKAYCWGANYNGNLGLGYSDFDPHDTPGQVVDLPSNLLDISAGPNQTCVLTNSGSVSCWGGSDVDHTPVPISGLENGVAAISTGGSLEYSQSHTCVLMKGTGAVKCFGHNNYSQLGDGTYNFFGELIPVDVLGISGNATSIQTGAVNSCAFFGSGAAACWGFDYQIETTPVDLVEVNALDLPPAIFFSNYDQGAPNSYFVITGLYFPPNEYVKIYINDVHVGNILANETGVFKFFTYFNVGGNYEVRVESSLPVSLSNGFTDQLFLQRETLGQDQLTIIITEGDVLRIKEGDGYTFGETAFYFIPLMMK